MKKIPFYHQLIATGLGVGHFPYGPGTMGALLAILVWYPIATYLSYPFWIGILFGLIIIFTLLGVEESVNFSPPKKNY